MSQKTFAVIDGNSLMHRAFHATPPNLSTRDGRPTNAIFGFFNMFIKLVETFNPDGVICAFDKGKPQVRIDMLEQYKAQRPPMDPGLRPQFAYVKELLGALSIPVCEAEGWEGDDILGTLARQGAEAGHKMLLFTGDRDMYQLSNENVSIVATKKGVSDVAIMTPDSVADLYSGITPAQVPDFYGLKGDTSDNIPGVPGIGKVKAAQLIVQYGTLENLLDHADEIKGKMGENLRAHIEDARISKKVATILTNAPVEVDFEHLSFPQFDPEVMGAAFVDFELTSVMHRFLKMAGVDAYTGEAAPATPTFELPRVEKDADAAAKLIKGALMREEFMGVATELEGDAGSLLCTEHLWVALSDVLIHLTGDVAHSTLLQLIREGNIASCDMKAIIRPLMPKNLNQAAEISVADIDARHIFDCAVAAYLLNSDAGAYAPADLLSAIGIHDNLPEPTSEMSEAALSAYVAKVSYEPLKEKLVADGSWDVMRTIEMPLLPVLSYIERQGLHADAAMFKTQSDELASEMEQVSSHIFEVAGEEFNLNSTQQLSRILFDVLGLPSQGLKRTKSGLISTNAKVLASLAEDHDIVADVLAWRERAKIKSTYLDALPELIQSDGRIHTSLNQTVAATGRLSSSDPNLQNIPTRSALGHRVRTAFTVDDESVFLAVDYSQIELRLLAHLSGDEHLIRAFKEGEDFHAETAARVFGVDVSQVTPELRSRAKAVNFGIVYGQQAFGLSSALKISRAEAQDMISAYFAAYPGVRAYLDELVKVAHQTGYAVTAYGRKRHIKEFAQRNKQLIAYGERTAMNHPIQGTAADIIKLAMVGVERELRERNFKSKLVLQIHDELDLEVPKSELEAVQEMVIEVMQGVTELKVPLVADASWGTNWADAK